jgi:F-type H+-transporting ATPase subunit delta
MAAAQRMYARALFEAAKEQGRVEAVQQELDDFRTTVAGVPELRSLLENPQLDPAAKRAALADLLTDADDLVRNFLLLITEKGRAAELDEIAAELDDLVAREQGRLNVELTTAYELSDEEAQAILRKIEEASGRTVEAVRQVDPELVGGMVLQAGSMRVDASVRGRLTRLQQALAKGARA